MKSICVCAFLLIIGSILVVFGQDRREQSKTIAPIYNNDNQVEVKTDRFSGATTITLKPQTILDTPDQIITMRLEVKFDDLKNKPISELGADILGEGAVIFVESFANKPTDFGDQELHFIIDGKPLKIGESAGGTPTTSNKPEYRVLKQFNNSLLTERIKRLAAGHRVEMRLGKYEFVLKDDVLTNIQAFARAYLNHAPSSQLKGKGKQL
jgi:hypothetical protein